MTLGPITRAVLEKLIDEYIYPSPFVRLDYWIIIYIPSFKKELMKDKIGRKVWKELEKECKQLEDKK